MNLKQNALAAFLANSYFDLRNRGLEKLIFTATTGRSGTKTLANIFSIVPGFLALHEPYPIMNDKVLRAATYGDLEYVERIYRQVKSVNIRRAAVGYRYYLESSHLFVKTFIHHAARDFGNRVGVIHLVRAPTEVANSIYQLQHYPGTEEGNRWWLDHRAPSNRIKLADILDTHKEFSHPFYRGLWYWFEIETRIAEWEKRLPSVPFIRFETNWLSDEQRVFNLLDRLNVKFDKSAIHTLIGSRENVREHHKLISPVGKRESALMLTRFQELVTENGFTLPLLHA